MIGPWALYSIVLATLIALAAVAAERLAAVCRAPRRVTWLAALIAAVGLPAILATGVTSRQSPLEIITVGDSSSVRDGSVQTTNDGSAPFVARGIVRHPRLVVSREELAAMEPGFIALWLTASAALLVTVVGAATRLRMTSRRWRETALDGVQVLIAPETGPAVVGVLRPRIVIPEWALSLDARARALMLRHELEHIRARDTNVLLLATLSMVLVPWNAALWFIARRLRLAVELDCDRRVVNAIDDVRAYGLLLLDVGARRSTRRAIGAALVERRSFLARRIATMIANKPRHGVLISMLAVVCVAVVSIAAIRVPRPQALRIISATPQRAAATLARWREIDGETRSTIIRVVPPTPRITADWENAPIEGVVAAFAKFSGRKISLANQVSWLVTAHIVDQPWDEALADIVHWTGHDMVIQRDSSIQISAVGTRQPASGVRLARSPRAADMQNESMIATPTPHESMNRRIIGRALDDSTDAPIAGTDIRVIGLQAIGEPNRTCTSEQGQFQLIVPAGEVWLDASARGYQFSRVTLAPNDSVAVFRGRRTRSFSSARLTRGQIESVNVLKGPAASAVYGAKAANGVVVISTNRGNQSDSSGPRPLGFWLRGVAVTWPAAPTPLFVIDGVVVDGAAIDVPTACERS